MKNKNILIEDLFKSIEFDLYNDEVIAQSYEAEYEAEVFQGPKIGPGKKNFNQLYKRIKSELKEITCKISAYSDEFEEGKNYAGMIVYSLDDQFKWRNDKGRARGQNGRSFYIVIQCTDEWPSEVFKEAKQGRVHDYLIRNTLGIEYNQKIVCCGGFSYHDRKLKHSSVWLNGVDQKGSRTDGSKYLSDSEKVLVEYCFEKYKELGINKVFELPERIDRLLSEDDYLLFEERYDV